MDKRGEKQTTKESSLEPKTYKNTHPRQLEGMKEEAKDRVLLRKT